MARGNVAGVLIELGGGTNPHPLADVVIDLHHPKNAPPQDASARPWIANWHLSAGSADEVYASHFMEHIPHGQPLINVMNEAWRVLKPGGRFNMVLPLIGYTDPLSGNPMKNQIGWQPWADPTHVSFWWFPEALLYFCEGPFKPHADYGMNTWSPLGGWTEDPHSAPGGGWAVKDGWEGWASLLKP